MLWTDHFLHVNNCNNLVDKHDKLWYTNSIKQSTTNEVNLMKEIKLSEIKYGDIIEIKPLEDYEEDGGDITDLVKKFAGQKCTVHKVVEEDGEITISAGNSDLGNCSFKEYEVAKAYRVFGEEQGNG